MSELYLLHNTYNSPILKLSKNLTHILFGSGCQEAEEMDVCPLLRNKSFPGSKSVFSMCDPRLKGEFTNIYLLIYVFPLRS